MAGVNVNSLCQQIGLCCVLVLLIHQKRALWVNKLVPIKGVEEQLNVCNHVACRLCLLLAFDANKSLNCNFWNLTLHAYLDLKHYKILPL